MAAPPPPTEIDKEERTLAMLCHLGALLTGFIAPLIIGGQEAATPVVAPCRSRWTVKHSPSK